MEPPFQGNGKRQKSMTPLTKILGQSLTAARREPALWAWASSVGLHLVLLAWLGHIVSIEVPRVGMETGEQCPILVHMDSPGLGNAPEPSVPLQEASKISAPSLPVQEPLLSAIPPVSPPTLPKPAIEEIPTHLTEAPIFSTAQDAPTPSASKTAALTRHRSFSQQPVGSSDTPTSGESGGQFMRLGTEGMPTALQNPPPEYPLEERQAGHEGTVVLWIRIESNGTPSKVSIATSSGFARLDASACNTVSRRWHFRAARQSGTPIAAEFLLPIRFALKEYRRLTLL